MFLILNHIINKTKEKKRETKLETFIFILNKIPYSDIYRNSIT